MTRVKVCGLMNADDIRLCARLGVHAIGLVVEYPEPVPWNLTRDRARALIGQAPPFVGTCMVTGGAPERVVALARAVRPQAVQLHGDETLGQVEAIARALRPLGIATVKALRLNPDGALRFQIPDVAAAAEALSGVGIDALLIDACAPGRPGGSGRTVDARCYRAVRAHTALPIVLAGGLSADNYHRVVPRDDPPFAVDALTGTERAPGHKDEAKVAALMRAAIGDGRGI